MFGYNKNNQLVSTDLHRADTLNGVDSHEITLYEYVYFTGNTYVSLSSLCSWDYERYKDCYVPIYGNEILKSELPMSAQLVGETVFVGYHMPVTDELETNAFREPVPVYKDNTDINMLYVGNNNMIYVPLE